MPFLTTASQIFSLAPIYFSNPILKQNAFSIIPQCPCGRCLPHGRDHTFTSLFTRNQLPTMQVKKKRISSESKHSEKLKHRISFFSDTSHPFPVCLTQSLRARETTGSRQKKQQSPPCAPSSKYIFAGAGVPQRPRRQQSRQPLAPGEGSETRFNLARKGQMHHELLSSACLVNPNADLGGTNTGKFSRRSREWGFTCRKLRKLNWVTIS